MSQVVIYIGVLTEYQGIDLLIEAIPLVTRELPDVKFLVVGYPNEDSYRQKARVLGVEKFVHFTGKIPHEDLPRYLSLADVAVSPKISTTEANLKLFSYLGMALPTVVFDNPINREILGDLGLGFGVHHAEQDVRVALGGRLEHWREIDARLAPRRPEIDDDEIVIDDGVLEIGFGEFDNGHGAVL